MKIISTISLTRALKGEFSTIVEGVLAIVVSFDPEAMKIAGFYNKLQQKYHEVYLLRQMQQKNILSAAHKDQRKQRRNLIIAICRQVKAVQKANLAEQRSAVELLLPVVKMHLSALGRKGLPAIHDQVVLFTSKIKESEELKSAARETGVEAYVNKLKELEDSLSAQSQVQVEDNSKRRVITLQENRIKEDVVSAFNRLITAIELAREEYPEVDYNPMIAQLNEFLAPYQGTIKARSTRSKNKATKQKTVAMSATTSATAV